MPFSITPCCLPLHLSGVQNWNGLSELSTVSRGVTMMTKFKEIKTSQSLISWRKGPDRTGGDEREMSPLLFKPPKWVTMNKTLSSAENKNLGIRNYILQQTLTMFPIEAFPTEAQQSCKGTVSKLYFRISYWQIHLHNSPVCLHLLR